MKRTKPDATKKQHRRKKTFFKTAKKVTTETKKAGSKSNLAASTQSLQDRLKKESSKIDQKTKIDVSDYDASKAEVTNKVLKDNSFV